MKKTEREREKSSIHLGYSWVGRLEPTETETSSAGLLSPKFNVLTESNEAGSVMCVVDDGHIAADSTRCEPRRPVNPIGQFAVSDETIAHVASFYTRPNKLSISI